MNMIFGNSEKNAEKVNQRFLILPQKSNVYLLLVLLQKEGLAKRKTFVLEKELDYQKTS